MSEAKGPEPKKSWEDECKDRIRSWRIELEGLEDKPDAEKLQKLEALKAAIEVQVGLADIQIKARSADWAKLMAWAPFLLGLVGFIGVLVGAWLKR
jgi:hemolysin activation/secretion protein